MKNKLKNICISVTLLALTACGGGSGGSGSTTPSTGESSSTNNPNGGGTTSNPNTPPPVNYGNNAVGVLQFGLIKNARIEIYKIDASGTRSKKPIFKEKTTDGNINQAGFFNTHSSELEDKTYYVYKYAYTAYLNEDKKTQDIDTNLDGKEDTKYIPMDSGIGSTEINIEVMVRGEWIKNLGNKPFRITPMLHAIQRTVNQSGATSGLYEKFSNQAKQYIKKDINKDGVIDIKDAIVYDAVYNQQDTYLAYKDLVQRSEMSEFRDYDTTGEYYSTDKGSMKLNCNPFFGTALRDDSVAIAAGSDALYTIDISDPSDMSLLGELGGENHLVAFSKSSHNIVYIAEGVYSPRNHNGRSFKIIDISNANAPKVITTVGADNIESFKLSSDMKQLYILRATGALEVYSLEDEQYPKLIKQMNVSSDAMEIELSEDKNKLHIVSIDKGYRILLGKDELRTIRTVDINTKSISKHSMTYRNQLRDVISEKNKNLITMGDTRKDKKFQFQCSLMGKAFKSYTK